MYLSLFVPVISPAIWQYGCAADPRALVCPPQSEAEAITWRRVGQVLHKKESYPTGVKFLINYSTVVPRAKELGSLEETFPNT